MSAIGSVIDIVGPLPARFRHARDVTAKGKLTEADPAELKLPQIAARSTAPFAAVLLARRKLRLPIGLDDHCGSCHVCPYFPNGIPSSRKRTRACSSFFADVTMVMFIPFDLSALTT